MPSLYPNHFPSTYTNVNEFRQEVWDALWAHPRSSNILLADVLQARQREAQTSVGLDVETPPPQLWITCSTRTASQPQVDLILSCTSGPLGAYPIFIYSTQPASCLTPSFLGPRLTVLIMALLAAVPVERVYSVFAPDLVTKMFAELWTNSTGVEIDPNGVYYHASLSYCTRETFKNDTTTLPGSAFELQPAREGDIGQVAQLFYLFAAGSAPFSLTEEGTFLEAKTRIRNQQLWVLRVIRGDQPPEIACVVVISRETPTVTAITKVYTHPKWRGHGCAERLVRRVCKDLLMVKKKESVVLYVAHNNPRAAGVYHRVGFAGLDPAETSVPVEGVDSWLEYGFDRSKVQLGHW